MRASPITKLSITCMDCGTKISCKIPESLSTEFNCPLCGSTLFGNFHQALLSALAYNKAVADIMHCQQEYGVEFDG